MKPNKAQLLLASAAAAGLVTIFFATAALRRADAQPPAPAVDAGWLSAPGWVDVEGGTRHLGARIDGIVQQVAVQPGDEVAANALLLRFDDRQSRIDAQLAALEVRRSDQQQSALAARIKRAREQIARLQPLVTAQAEPADALTEQQHALADLQAQAALAQLSGETATLQSHAAQDKLARMELRAPSAGRVLRVSAHAGEAVSSGSELIWFAAAGALMVRAELDERLFGKVRAGMDATISPEYDDRKSWPAQVIRIAGSVGPVRDLPDVRAAPKDDRVVECDLRLSGAAPLLIGQRVLVRVHSGNAP